MKKLLKSVFVSAACLLGSQALAAEPPLKIGLIGPFSGPSYEAGGEAFEEGIKTFFKINGTEVAGRKVEIIRRDVPEPSPGVAKRVATELVTQDKVDFLTGVIFTPNAMAIGQVSGGFGKPFVIMNAATSGIMEKIPNAVRLSFTLPQATEPLAKWAAKSGMKRVFVIVADYAPGYDAANAFTRAYTQSGGEIVETLKVPLTNIEFRAYVRRIQDSKADAVYVFLPTSDTARSFLKAFNDAGLHQSVKLLADGGVTSPTNLAALGDSAIGVITSHHYSEAHPSSENEKFVKVYAEENKGRLPTYISVAAYDAMRAIYKAVDEQKGKLELETTMRILSNLEMESPRGPIKINPANRDINQNIYIRRVERRGDKLVNVEFETLEAVAP